MYYEAPKKSGCALHIEAVYTGATQSKQQTKIAQKNMATLTTIKSI